MKRIFRFISFAVALSLMVVPAAFAQLNSNVGTVTLNATLPESLTVNITSGATVNFTLAANTAANPGGTTTTAQTAWVLQPGRTQVAIWAWVPNSAAVLTAGGNNIAASQVTATATGSGSAGGLLNATTGAGLPSFVTGTSPSGVQIGSVAITGANKASNTTTTLTWNINTTSTPQLPAGTYTGTVNIQAQATP